MPARGNDRELGRITSARRLQGPARRRNVFGLRRAVQSRGIYIGAGRQTGIRPADLVGAIIREAGVDAHALGTIEIADGFPTVEVPEQLAKRIIGALSRGHASRPKGYRP